MPIVICTSPRFSFASITTVAQTSGSSVDDIDVPGGTTTGDVTYIMAMGDSGELDVGSPPSGWTEIFASGGGVPYFLWRRVWASPPIGQVDGGTNGDGIWISTTFRGLDTTTPEDVTYTVTSGVGTQPNPPSITPLSDGCKIMALGFATTVYASMTYPSGYTDDNRMLARSGFSYGTLMIGCKTLSTAAAENPGTFAASGSSSWVAASLALRPAAS